MTYPCDMSTKIGVSWVGNWGKKKLDKSVALVQWVTKMNLQNILVDKMMDFEIGMSVIQFDVGLNAGAWRIKLNRSHAKV